MPGEVRRPGAFVLLGALVLLLLAGCAGEERPIRIGVFAACMGGNSIAYESRLAGAELPLLRRGASAIGTKPSAGLEGASVGGRPVELVLGCDDDSPEGSLEEARRLVESEHVDILVGPAIWTSLHEYAWTKPDVTFLPPSIGLAQSLQKPVPNLFSFLPAAVTLSAGLGAHAYRDLGWRKAVVVGDFTSVDFVAGFVAEFCSLGGEVVERAWLPASVTDFREAAAAIPTKDVDGYFVGAQTGNFSALIQAWPALPYALGGRVLAGFISVFPPELEQLGDRLLGVSQSPYALITDSPGMRAAEMELGRAFPEAKIFDSSWTRLGVSGGSLYFLQVEAALRALEATGGDLSGDQQRFRESLRRTVVPRLEDGAAIRLDERQQAIWPTVLTRTERRKDGTLAGRVFRSVPGVEQTYGGLFGPETPPFGRESPPCVAGNPPPWARVAR